MSIQLPKRSRFFLDTEFVENGTTIDLISIGIVDATGLHKFYACSTEARLDLASPWVRRNVLPHLPPYEEDYWMTRSQMRDAIEHFVDTFSGKEPVEFWAYYADYDWVALCQLFGKMINLPKNFPKLCMDLKQYSIMLGSPKHPKQLEKEHDALADAEWNLKLFRHLNRVAKRSAHGKQD